MSHRFGDAMRGLSTQLKSVYQAHAVAIVPGGGTYGMEAVARQFATDQSVLVVRNGWFSYRWSQILDAGRISRHTTVCQAQPLSDEAQSPWQPCPLAEVLAAVEQHRPGVVFVPHVETSSGMLLPNAYIEALAKATHAVGGVLVLDCIASGAMWVNMQALGVDVLISAPQKGWSSTPCAALVMLSQQAQSVMQSTESSSFACDLKKWASIMTQYEQGGHAYHATMPTDGLLQLHHTMLETCLHGLEALRQHQMELGARVRALLTQNGWPSVAAMGFESPSVVVCHTTDPELQNAKKWMAQGLQTATGVPLQCGENTQFKTFRIGLFGLDKLLHIDRTVAQLKQAIAQM
jgi:aspartate aminotransferase-like enzyme